MKRWRGDKKDSLSLDLLDLLSSSRTSSFSLFERQRRVQDSYSKFNPSDHEQWDEEGSNRRPVQGNLLASSDLPGASVPSSLQCSQQGLDNSRKQESINGGTSHPGFSSISSSSRNIQSLTRPAKLLPRPTSRRTRLAI